MDFRLIEGEPLHVIALKAGLIDRNHSQTVLCPPGNEHQIMFDVRKYWSALAIDSVFARLM